MHDGRWLSQAHPPFDRSCFYSCWVSCHPPHQKEPGGGAGLDADNPSMWQVVLGYMLPVAGSSLT